MNKENNRLFNEYEEKYKENAVNAIIDDYRHTFKAEPPFQQINNSTDVYSKYTFEEEIDVYLTALRTKKPYTLKESDLVYEEIF